MEFEPTASVLVAHQRRRPKYDTTFSSVLSKNTVLAKILKISYKRFCCSYKSREIYVKNVYLVFDKNVSQGMNFTRHE